MTALERAGLRVRLLVQVEEDEPAEVCELPAGRYPDPARLALLVDSASASALNEYCQAVYGSDENEPQEEAAREWRAERSEEEPCGGA